jgi:hypothetical protein
VPAGDAAASAIGCNVAADCSLGARWAILVPRRLANGTASANGCSGLRGIGRLIHAERPVLHRGAGVALSLLKGWTTQPPHVKGGVARAAAF